MLPRPETCVYSAVLGAVDMGWHLCHGDSSHGFDGGYWDRLDGVPVTDVQQVVWPFPLPGNPFVSPFPVQAKPMHPAGRDAYVKLFKSYMVHSPRLAEVFARHAFRRASKQEVTQLVPNLPVVAARKLAPYFYPETPEEWRGSILCPLVRGGLREVDLAVQTTRVGAWVLRPGEPPAVLHGKGPLYMLLQLRDASCDIVARNGNETVFHDEDPLLRHLGELAACKRRAPVVM